MTEYVMSAQISRHIKNRGDDAQLLVKLTDAGFDVLKNEKQYITPLSQV
jgi:hypothetical protein